MFHANNLKPPWKRLEERTARAVGSTRTCRAFDSSESAPDVAPVRLPSGVVLVFECKYRRSGLALLQGALRQARSYALPGQIGAVVSQTDGSPPLVTMSLADFRRAVGLEDAPAQQGLFGGADG
jgi:hypothetical protein